MKKTEALRLLKSQLHVIPSLKTKRASNDFTKWHRDSRIVVERVFGTNAHQTEDFEKIGFSPITVTAGTTDAHYQASYEKGLQTSSAILASMIKEVSDFWKENEDTISSVLDANATLTKICSRFHIIARQLQVRQRNKIPFAIDDEYDVQDLFHALLKLDFDDIRTEEWTPSYAGSGSRMDFLLKDEKMVIEIKKTRKGLGQGELGKELIIDIEKYKSHPDCKRLFCFVYDPDGFITNPRGMEKDLNRDSTSPSVRVIIQPS